MRRVAAMVFAALSAASCAAPVTVPATPSSNAAPATALGLGERTHEAGAVGVTASWIAGTSSARVALDTHSVDLDGLDLKELARLRLDGGAWVTPTSWEAPKGGHHRSGTLAFGSLAPDALAGARTIELEIQGAGELHVLRWEPSR